MVLEAACSESDVVSLKALCIDKLAKTLPQETKHSLYADDLAIWSSSPDQLLTLSRRPSTTLKNGP